MQNLVDVHTHLDFPEFKEDLHDVVLRAKAAGVCAVITQGVSHEKNLPLLELAKEDPMIKVAFGLYPLNAKNVVSHSNQDADSDHDPPSEYTVDETLSAIKENSDGMIAIGEVGMDFHFSDDKEHQTENFRKIIRLAKELHKPLIIHSRKAEKEVIDMLEEEKFFHAVMHCFCGSKKLIARGVKLGLYFSIPCAVVRNPQFQMLAEMVPIGQMLTETDAPYLSPMKGVRNEPAYIKDAVIKIAEIKRMDPVETANAIYFNYQKVFL